MFIFGSSWKRRTLLQIIAAAVMVPIHPLIVIAGRVIKVVRRG